MKLALFDLDHTLLPLDSDFSWGQFTVELGWRDAVTHTQTNQAFYEQYCAGTLNITDHVRFSTESLREQGMAAAHAAHERFMRDVIRPAMRPAALELVANYRQAGYATLLVTATNAFVTRPIAEAFGMDELIAIDLAVDASGTPTGEIHGTPSFREGKVARVDQRSCSWADVTHSVLYSDSMNDLPLLERVHEPVATNPDARLRDIATQRGWRILNLFE